MACTENPQQNAREFTSAKSIMRGPRTAGLKPRGLVGEETWLRDADFTLESADA